MIAITASGKTTVLFNIIKECAGKKTKIIALVSTLYNDNNWHVIKKWRKDDKIEFVGHTSIYEDNKDLLKDMPLNLQKRQKKWKKKRRVKIQ